MSHQVDAVTRAAIDAIGHDRMDSDWALDPKGHIASFRDAQGAAALVRILQRQETADIVKRFSGCDGIAVAAQARYKYWGRLGIFATMMATLIGSLFLLPIQGWEYFTQFRGGGLVAQYCVLALAFFATWKVARDKSYADWQEHRGAAEIARAELFDKVVGAQEPVNDGELPLLPLQLEYFRRYQHDVQRRYYKGRGAQHASGAMRSRAWRWFSWTAYGIAATVAIPAVLLVISQTGWIDIPPVVAPLLDNPIIKIMAQVAEKSLIAVGVMASAVHAANDARTRMDMDERNAARFALTSQNLEFLADEELNRARASAASGDNAAVLRFVDKVQRQISWEHQQWVLLSTATGKVVV